MARSTVVDTDPAAKTVFPRLYGQRDDYLAARAGPRVTLRERHGGDSSLTQRSRGWPS
jgi:hypothetical protein